MVLTLNIEVAEPLAGGMTEPGLKLAVAPEGKPAVTERLTAELKPFKEVMVMVEDWEVPVLGDLMAEGLAEIVKSGATQAPFSHLSKPKAVQSTFSTAQTAESPEPEV